MQPDRKTAAPVQIRGGRKTQKSNNNFAKSAELFTIKADILL